MTSRPRVLIIEDEASIRRGLEEIFLFHKYDVESASDGDSGLKKALSGMPDLLIIDVMLPGQVTGFDICEKVRKAGWDQAIIFLTAKTDEAARLKGLSMGADDYVTKPFYVSELVMRAEAILRRVHVGTDRPTTLCVGGLDIDVRGLFGRSRDKLVDFTQREMDILVYLFAHSHRTVSREELLAKVWGYANHLDLETRTVDIHVAKLRKKIEADPQRPLYIKTIWAKGYRFYNKT